MFNKSFVMNEWNFPSSISVTTDRDVVKFVNGYSRVKKKQKHCLVMDHLLLTYLKAVSILFQ